MHQPSYVDPIRGTALMPWVRLHATKGYLDMIWLADQFPELRCTFNLTPVLVEQIEQLAAGRVRDQWHEFATTPAADLSFAQKCGLLEHFFKANWDHMIKRHPRYWSLLQKRGLNISALHLDRIVGNFSEQDYRDLQVWFNLAWFGFAADRLYPEITELKRKGRDFTESDKRVLFEQQQDVLRGVLKFYRALSDRGQIEITTTPYYHPIMPLVYNTEFARRCMPGATLPPSFAHPEDVRGQLLRARNYHEQVFGTPPRGLWPSEGSVCPELVPILDELGFEWFATDEDIMWRSFAVSHPGRYHDRMLLFQGHRVHFGDTNVCAAFRERALSDFVGFTASRNDPRRAADHMLGHFEQIARAAREPNPLCTVVLDGENAWEYFPDGGEQFLRELYQRLTGNAEIKTTRFCDYFAAHPPQSNISALHTGSWISADFHIWVGHPEDNRGWELLGRTRDFLQTRADHREITADQHQQALNEIYAAEGSDWFWWYGDDFVTDNDLIFDELFRTHLQNVYRICGAPIPDVLNTHICRSEVAHETRKPTDLIMPLIDGQITSYYEWSGSGVYEAGRAMSAMYRSERMVDSIHFGFDLNNLYLRIDLRSGSQIPGKTALRVNFVQPRHHTIIIPKLRPGHPKCELWSSDPEQGSQKLGEMTRVAFGKIVELAVPFSALGWQPREGAAFFAQLLDNQVELERHPEMGTLSFTVPDEQFEAENWAV
jgi:alpha-amylase/alpha-mannosidase (GH57 family)